MTPGNESHSIKANVHAMTCSTQKGTENQLEASNGDVMQMGVGALPLRTLVNMLRDLRRTAWSMEACGCECSAGLRVSDRNDECDNGVTNALWQHRTRGAANNVVRVGVGVAVCV